MKINEEVIEENNCFNGCSIRYTLLCLGSFEKGGSRQAPPMGTKSCNWPTLMALISSS